MGKPLVIDGYCGLGGWTEGFLAEGWECVGIDIERHDYGTGGYPGQLIIQDMRTVHGKQFKGASCLVFSPPCQEYSYMAMPWSLAKKKAQEYRDGTRDVTQLTALFDACFRIQRQASEAAGRHIPMIVENVCGAQKWVGRARWHYGSYYLWGDVPALMPCTLKRLCHKIESPHLWLRDPKMAGGKYAPDYTKVPGFRFDGSGKSFQTASVEGTKNHGGSWFAVAHNTTSGLSNNPVNREGMYKLGPCAKQRVICTIIEHTSGQKWIGENLCRNPQTSCPRQGMKTGEGYELCKDVCLQIGHAEIMAASSVNRALRDATAYVEGHYYACEPCKEALNAVGVKKIVFEARNTNGTKQGGEWWHDPKSFTCRTSSKSNAHRAASAMIARIPAPLSQYIAQVFKP